MTKRFRISVEVEVTLDLDESKFTPEFLKEYCRDFSNLEDLSDHAKNLAWLYATGRADEFGSDWIEGYGDVSDMGIKLIEIDDAGTAIIHEGVAE